MFHVHITAYTFWVSIGCIVKAGSWPTLIINAMHKYLCSTSLNRKWRPVGLACPCQMASGGRWKSIPLRKQLRSVADGYRLRVPFIDIPVHFSCFREGKKCVGVDMSISISPHFHFELGNKNIPEMQCWWCWVMGTLRTAINHKIWEHDWHPFIP